MKVAFATQDMKTMDAHFGSARNISIWEVGKDDSKFLEAISFEDVSEADGNHAPEGEDRLGPKVDAMEGCSLLFVLAIGGPAAARVVNSKIHPIKLPKAEPIADIIARVQTMMQGNPPPWLRKVMMDDSKKFEFMEE